MIPIYESEFWGYIIKRILYDIAKAPEGFDLVGDVPIKDYDDGY